MSTPTTQTHCKPAQVAARLGVTTATVYGWIRKRELPAFRIGRSVLVSLEDLEQMIATRTQRKDLQSQPSDVLV